MGVCWVCWWDETLRSFGAEGVAVHLWVVLKLAPLFAVHRGTVGMAVVGLTVSVTAPVTDGMHRGTAPVTDGMHLVNRSTDWPFQDGC